MELYSLNEKYICNLAKDGKAIPFSNDEQGSLLYQVKVYEYAQKVIKNEKLKSMVDIGCGYGAKLERIIYPVCENIVGIDMDEAINYCKTKFPFGKWYSDDVENPALRLNRKFDLVLSSDVIEHLVTPDKLIEYIKNFCHQDTHIIISTPERDKIINQSPFGPPKNINHVREWNRKEFKTYIQSRNLRIIRHFLLGERFSSLRFVFKKILLLEPIRKIQIVHCKMK